MIFDISRVSNDDKDLLNSALKAELLVALVVVMESNQFGVWAVVNNITAAKKLKATLPASEDFIIIHARDGMWRQYAGDFS